MNQVNTSVSSGSPDGLPPLRECYGEFKAFGWDHEPPDVVEWAAKHGYPNEIYVNAMDKLAKSLPENHIRITRVRDKKTYGDKICKMCLVIATNRSDKDRQRALDKELIESYRAVHGWDKPPQWFDYVPDF
ncbi:hypothetical protein C0989_004749 [Termitomyces sp. Mn162]|nr:hypothetical protein C0989_004749 [Termitomyces sp. Mn162]